MDTSRYFERTIFYDRSPAADEYYARSAERIFEEDPKLAKIEVRLQSSSDVSIYDRNVDQTSREKPEELYPKCMAMNNLKASPPDINIEPPTTQADIPYSPDDDDACSISSRASSTALPAALDERRVSGPPLYPGPPKLTVIDLELGRLQDFIKVSKVPAITILHLVIAVGHKARLPGIVCVLSLILLFDQWTTICGLNGLDEDPQAHIDSKIRQNSLERGEVAQGSLEAYLIVISFL
jgi:hypothetical protein